MNFFALMKSSVKICLNYQIFTKMMNFQKYMLPGSAQVRPAQKAAYTLPDGQNPHYIKIFIRSCLAYNLKLAQMAEWLRQWTCKQEVASLSPLGNIFFAFFSIV